MLGIDDGEVARLDGFDVLFLQRDWNLSKLLTSLQQIFLSGVDA